LSDSDPLVSGHRFSDAVSGAGSLRFQALPAFAAAKAAPIDSAANGMPEGMP
jgi:hypothetical protein